MGLFTPLKIKNVVLKNRIAVSPMCQYSSEDGFANDWHLVHLGSRAVGGAGLVFTEATAVSPEGRISPADLGIWDDDHIPFLRRITAFVEARGSLAGIQLAHAGRKSSTQVSWKGGEVLTPENGGWSTVAPSAVPFRLGDPVPAELDGEQITRILHDFRSAARRARQAGFKVVEIHAAHGYLIHEFLSPLSNRRTDGYGGSFEHRIRFLLEVVEAVREEWPEECPLFVRISATDWTAEGWTEDDSVRLAAILQNRTVDLVDCSTGGNVPDVKIPVGSLYQVGFAERIKKETGMLTGAVGLITTPEEAESVITGNRADLVLLAREFLRDPYFPRRAAAVLHADTDWPPQYERAKRKR